MNSLIVFRNFADIHTQNLGQTDKQTNKHTDKQTDRQTDKERDKTVYRVAPQLKK